MGNRRKQNERSRNEMRQPGMFECGFTCLLSSSRRPAEQTNSSALDNVPAELNLFFFSSWYSALTLNDSTYVMLCNNQSQGSLYLKDAGVDARPLHALSDTFTALGCTGTWCTQGSSWGLSRSFYQQQGSVCDVFSCSQNKKKNPSVLLRDQRKRKKMRACQEGSAAHKIWVFLLTALRESLKNHPYIVVICLTFVSEWIPLVLCPTIVSVPHGLGFSAVGCCGLLKETSCRSTKAVWKLPPSFFISLKILQRCTSVSPHNRDVY